MPSPKIRKLRRLKRLRNLGLTNKSSAPKETVEVVEEPAPVEVIEEPTPVEKKIAIRKVTKKKKLWSSKGE